MLDSDIEVVDNGCNDIHYSYGDKDYCSLKRDTLGIKVNFFKKLTDDSDYQIISEDIYTDMYEADKIIRVYLRLMVGLNNLIKSKTTKI